uniref:Uncharacterized protein n=1 Tax=Gasterosteus aculeatus aculeatus TaxID=481459 RepID=A0AAQ4R6K9_GASAC
MSLGDCWKQLSWFYYQYLLVTALYMLEPWERTVFSILQQHLTALFVMKPKSMECLKDATILGSRSIRGHVVLLPLPP